MAKPTAPRKSALSKMMLSPKPTADAAKSLQIRLHFQGSPGIVTFALTADEAMTLMDQLQKFQKRYAWSVPGFRKLKREEVN